MSPLGIIDTATRFVTTTLETVTGAAGGLLGSEGPTGALGLTGGNGNGALGVGGLFGVDQLVSDLLNIPGDILSEALTVIGLGGAGGAAVALAGGIDAARFGKVIDTTGFSKGNGKVATRTIVQTMDLATGRIVSEKKMPGSPHLMNFEIRAAKKVFRQVRKLDSRLPKKTQRQSKVSQLKDAAVDAAIANVSCPPPCPPKC